MKPGSSLELIYILWALKKDEELSPWLLSQRFFQSIELPPDYLTYGRQSRGEGGRDDDPDEMHLFESPSLPLPTGEGRGEREERQAGR